MVHRYLDLSDGMNGLGGISSGLLVGKEVPGIPIIEDRESWAGNGSQHIVKRVPRAYESAAGGHFQLPNLEADLSLSCRWFKRFL